MTCRLALVACGTAFALVGAWPGAGVRAAEDFTDAQKLTSEELADVRGGLRTPDGLEFSFGAVMRTYVDGALVLQTRLTWTPAGPERTLEFGQLNPDIAAAAAAGGVKLQGPPLQGVVVPGQGGLTAVAQTIDDNQITHLIINNANNRDIRQDTQITLDIPELAQMQQAVAVQAMGLRLHDATAAALRDAAQ